MDKLIWPLESQICYVIEKSFYHLSPVIYPHTLFVSLSTLHTVALVLSRLLFVVVNQGEVQGRHVAILKGSHGAAMSRLLTACCSLSRAELYLSPPPLLWKEPVRSSRCGSLDLEDGRQNRNGQNVDWAI